MGDRRGQEAERMETGIGGAESGGPEGWKECRGGSRRSKVQWERERRRFGGCWMYEGGSLHTGMSAEETKPRVCEQLGGVMTGRIRLGAAWQRHNAAGHFVVQNRMVCVFTYSSQRLPPVRNNTCCDILSWMGSIDP